MRTPLQTHTPQSVARRAGWPELTETAAGLNEFPGVRAFLSALGRRSREPDRNVRAPFSVTLAILAAAVMPLAGQTFNSQSDGSDGALDLSNVEPGTTVVFDPAAFDPPLDPDGDNVFHFTTINIPEGVTVRLLAPQLNWAPVYWLASGEARIDGTIDLRGENGHRRDPTPDERRPSIPGPGGFPGGIGGNNVSAATPGLGPGGTTSGATHNYGNVYLLPLTGGSGGGGAGGTGAGGGAGGGALQIVSSVSITINGTITARGGNVGAGGSGGTGFASGGSIRLVAPRIDGNGTINAQAGFAQANANSHGRIRLEAFDHVFTGNITTHFSRFRVVTLTPTTNLGLPTSPPPGLRALSIAGQPVAITPNGSFAVPDAVIDSAAPVEVVVQARQIPLGTTVQLTFFNENQANQTVTSTPLEGTKEASTATIEVTFPPGFSRGWARATW